MPAKILTVFLAAILNRNELLGKLANTVPPFGRQNPVGRNSVAYSAELGAADRNPASLLRPTSLSQGSCAGGYGIPTALLLPPLRLRFI
jgi:hypothetical protein